MTSIGVEELIKEYRGTRVVDRLTCSIEPGRVTGFLGPNGAGKSTTMRLVLGLDRPTSGTATVGGRPYATLREPLRTVGTLLDAQATHGSRSAPGTISASSPSATASRYAAGTRSFRTPVSALSHTAVSKPFHSACASGSASPQRS
jgi:ABC-type cobalamin/Fe3+-siderophores transport system ATPase subunit